MSARIYQFPRIHPKFITPASIHYKHARNFYDVNSLGHQHPDKLELTPSEMSAATSMSAPFHCENCGQKVLPWASEWWNAWDGRLHDATTCRKGAA